MPEPSPPADETPPGAASAPGGLVSGPLTLPAGAGVPLRRWLERGLLIVGFLCLGIWAYSALDARLFQAFAERRLEHELANGRSAPPIASTQTPSAGVLPGDEGVPYPLDGPALGRPAATGPAGPNLLALGDDIGRIEIPRLDLAVMVAEGADHGTLRRAAGHIPGTALPGGTDNAGNVGIAGHRDSFFRPLKDVREGDEVILTTAWGTWRYVVESTKIVPPDDTGVLAPIGRPILTLVTCYPFYYVGNAPKRFIVQAREIAAEGVGGP